MKGYFLPCIRERSFSLEHRSLMPSSNHMSMDHYILVIFFQVGEAFRGILGAMLTSSEYFIVIGHLVHRKANSPRLLGMMASLIGEKTNYNSKISLSPVEPLKNSGEVHCKLERKTFWEGKSSEVTLNLMHFFKVKHKSLVFYLTLSRALLKFSSFSSPLCPSFMCFAFQCDKTK